MKRRPDAGFSLAALIVFATAASILLATAVPAYRMQAQREVEEELIFRGEEYVRAIQKYQRKFNANPQSLDSLVDTNGLRFLRRAYKDPITDEPFRLISVNPDGTVNGSTLLTQRVNNTPLFGGALQTFGQQPQQPQQSPSQQQQPQPSQGQRGQPGQPLTGLGQARGGADGQANNPAGGNGVGLSGIIGVRSQSDETSVKVYNNRQKYSEWEFIAILGPQNQPGQPGQRGQSGQPGQPQQPAQQGPFAPSTGASPSGGQQPFGQQPFGGPPQGQQPIPQPPFGSGPLQPQSPIQKQ